VAAGLIDSFGFVDLVLFIEGQCGIKINLADADPVDFTVVKGLCNIVLASYSGDHQETNDMAVANDLRQL
jgi:acyl carrier protein